MHKKTIFLLQETKELNEELAEKFSNEKEFEVIGKATDGISALSMISDLKPKILITGLVISGYDGLSVIARAKELDSQMKVIVISALCVDDVISKAVGAGADYFMAKPYNYEILKERIKDMTTQSAEQPLRKIGNSHVVDTFHRVTLEEKISKIFINVGIPPHIKGYNFLREGVKMAVQDPEIINNITKKLYPMIGEKYQTTASKVERAIRHAIEVAWNRGRIDAINNILGVRAYVGAEKPTNGEFIALVADKLLLERE